MDEKLINILACPVCKGDINYDFHKKEVYCKKCGRAYPVEDGIPVMLEDRGHIRKNGGQ